MAATKQGMHELERSGRFVRAVLVFCLTPHKLIGSKALIVKIEKLFRYL